MKECSLILNGEVVLKFAAAYGFRNIQNVIRSIKSKRCDYDYVEIMACPRGCLNGGGQIKPKEMNASPKEVIEALEAQSLRMEQRELISRPEEQHTITQLIQMMAITYSGWHETEFKAVQKEFVPSIKW